MPGLRLTFLGTGTSMGVPTLGCECAVCRSSDPADQRLRPSVLLEFAGRAVVIDTSPDFRAQALRAGLKRVDAVLFTHGHADHILGLDDLRPYNLRQGGAIPIYASAETLRMIQKTFPYVFGEPTPFSTVPEVSVREVNGPFELFGVPVTPAPVAHGTLTVLGYRVGRAAYVTDFNSIPDGSLEKLRGLDLLVLDALRETPHPTHSTLEQSLALVKELKPRQTYFTHICHDLGHAQTNARLREGVALAYDGLQVEVEL